MSEPTPPSKRCPGPCGQVKPLSGFYRGHSKCKPCELAYKRATAQRAKACVLAHYGRVCACCGSTDDLGTDHVNGGGKAHRKALFGQDPGGHSFRYWSWLINQGFPDGFQTLCRRCNRSKGDGPACLLHGPLSPCKEGHPRVRVASGQIKCRECGRRYYHNRKRRVGIELVEGN